ncbi:ribosomal protein L11 methyltransferase [Impatiens glandulifera]|uniref:ribosomal protein L11 methyltransferase n=1 Tax=Impatiens glandulifera TaxID=253017 RepID=UPI001FB1651C|nr:ribosomal protein L11 methyltransferase [Impatiens glandulifera]
MMLNVVRSHFVKHLTCNIPATKFIRRLTHRRSLIPSLPSPQKLAGAAKLCSFSPAPATSIPLSADTCLLESSYLSVNIRCRRDQLDSLSEALICFGASSISVDEQEKDEEDDDEVSFCCIFADSEEDVENCVSIAADSIGLKEIPKFEIIKGYHSDWIKQSQESFSPVEVTKGLWIVPKWITPPVPEAMNILLNPGLAFGTGEHPTTKLCLLFLQQFIKGGERFMDYGTGSGILAIAALKFGAAFSVGLDIDPEAITVANLNASTNKIASEKLKLQLVASSTTTCSISEKFDIVIANILLNPLLDLADDIVSYAKPGGVIALSGIIKEQVPGIVTRYSTFLEQITVSEIDDWALVKGIRTTKN